MAQSRRKYGIIVGITDGLFRHQVSLLHQGRTFQSVAAHMNRAGKEIVTLQICSHNLVLICVDPANLCFICRMHVIRVVGLLCRPTPTEYRLPTHCVGSVGAGHTLS